MPVGNTEQKGLNSEDLEHENTLIGSSTYEKVLLFVLHCSSNTCHELLLYPRLYENIGHIHINNILNI